MIYTDSETIAKIHARGEKLTQAINNALTLAPQVKDALTRFLGKNAAIMGKITIEYKN